MAHVLFPSWIEFIRCFYSSSFSLCTLLLKLKNMLMCWNQKSFEKKKSTFRMHIAYIFMYILSLCNFCSLLCIRLLSLSQRHITFDSSPLSTLCSPKWNFYRTSLQIGLTKSHAQHTCCVRLIFFLPNNVAYWKIWCWSVSKSFFKRTIRHMNRCDEQFVRFKNATHNMQAKEICSCTYYMRISIVVFDCHFIWKASWTSAM